MHHQTQNIPTLASTSPACARRIAIKPRVKLLILIEQMMEDISPTLAILSRGIYLTVYDSSLHSSEYFNSSHQRHLNRTRCVPMIHTTASPKNANTSQASPSTHPTFPVPYAASASRFRTMRAAYTSFYSTTGRDSQTHSTTLSHVSHKPSPRSRYFCSNSPLLFLTQFESLPRPSPSRIQSPQTPKNPERQE